MTSSLLRAKALEIGYAKKALLAPIDLDIEPGQFWCLLGRNGAGKTTLVRTLLGLLPQLGGKRSRASALRIGYLPQKARFDELYPMSARDVVLMGTDRNLSFLRRRGREATGFADSAMTSLELHALARVRYRDLSEGQKQRVLMARLSASRPDLAFLDEPTTAMDQLAEEQAFQHLAQQCVTYRTSFVVVTHDFSLAGKYADHALFVDDSEHRVLVGPIEQILTSDALSRRFSALPKRSET